MSQRRSRSPSQDFYGYVRANCKQLLGSKFWDTRFVCRVDVGSKHDKLETRTLVLSKFRLFFLAGKHVGKLHIETGIHLLSLRALEVTGPNEVKIASEDGKKLIVRTHPDSNSTGHEFACELLKAFKHYFPGCTDTLKLFLELRPPDLYVEFASMPGSRPILPCDSFRRTYAALCDFYKQPFRDEVVWDVEKIYASHNLHILRLDDFTHLYPKDLIPIVAVLQFSKWFSGLTVENLKLAPELTDVILAVIRKSQWLKHLRLRNCGLSKDFVIALAQVLELNPTIPLETFDLSRNPFDDHKAVVQLGQSFSKLASGIVDVHMVECGLNSKAVNGIANGLFHSQNGCSSLRKLNFANNNLKDSLMDVHNLLSHCNSLEELDFSFTSMPLEKLWTALKYGGLKVHTLKLAGCVMPHSSRKTKESNQLSLKDIKEYFAGTVAIKHIDLSDCSTPPDVLKNILLGLACNQEIENVYLSLSRSCDDKKCVSVLETSLPSLRAVSSLVLRDNGFNQDLAVVLPAACRMPSLRHLDLGGNNFANMRNKNQEKLLPNLLMEIVKIINDEDGPLRELILSDCRLGVHLSVLLNALGVSPYLSKLDLSGNEIYNFGARLLGKALQINTSLETVVIDRNQITSEGYTDLAYALKENYTLVTVPYPLQDAAEAVGRGEKLKTEKALAKIEKLLFRNRRVAGGRVEKVRDSDRGYQAHSRLVMSNIEEELNKAIYAGNQYVKDAGSDNKTEQLQRVKHLLEDAEKAKELLGNALSMDDDFIDDLVDKIENDLKQEMMLKLEEFSHRASQRPVDKSFSICADSNMNSQLAEVADRKKEFDMTVPCSLFKSELRTRFRAATTAIDFAVLERLTQEIYSQISDVARTSGSHPRTLSQNSLNQSLPSPGGHTPKSNRKKEQFSHNTRPRSIVQGEGVPNSIDFSSTMVDPIREEASFDGTCPDTPDETDSADSIPFRDGDVEIRKPLGQILKSRPRNPNKRYTKPPITPISKSDFAAGLDSFLSGMDNTPPMTEQVNGEVNTRKVDTPPSNRKEALLPPKQTEKPVESEKQESSDPASPSRIPPGAVAAFLIDPQLIKGRKQNLNTPPRAPPNTPATPQTPLDMVNNVPTAVKKENGDLAAACRDALSSTTLNKEGADIGDKSVNLESSTTSDNVMNSSGEKLDDDWVIMPTNKNELIKTGVPSPTGERKPLPEKPSLTKTERKTTEDEPPPPKLPERNSLPLTVPAPPNRRPPGLPPKPGSISKELPATDLPQIKLRSGQKGSTESGDDFGRLLTSKSGDNIPESVKESGSNNPNRKSVMDLTARFEQKPSRPQPTPRRNKVGPTQTSE